MLLKTAEPPLQFVEHRHQPRVYALFCFGDREPGAAVDFGEALHHARARRPFQLEFVADDVVGVDIALDRKAVDDLAARLLRRRQRQEFAVYRLSRLLGELAARGIEGIFRVAELALWDRPGALIFLLPERPARVDRGKLQP